MAKNRKVRLVRCDETGALQSRRRNQELGIIPDCRHSDLLAVRRRGNLTRAQQPPVAARSLPARSEFVPHFFVTTVISRKTPEQSVQK